VSDQATAYQLRSTSLSVREQLDANRAGVAHAEAAPIRATIAAARWERRGVLQRLRRIPALHRVD